jgi:hypothetical protein
VHDPDALVVPKGSLLVLAIAILVSKPFWFVTSEKSNGWLVVGRGSVRSCGTSERAMFRAPTSATNAKPTALEKLQFAIP